MIRIVYATDSVIVLRVEDGPLWYIKTYANYPELYNDKLERQHCDIDVWVGGQTRGPYTYNSIIELADAFRSGLNVAYTKHDIESLVRSICISTISLIFRQGYSAKYASQYWVELATPKDFLSFVTKVREEFDVLRARLGDDKLYNYLCRLHQASVTASPSETAIFEKMIARLDRAPGTPTYPNTDQLDNAIADEVSTYVGTFKDVKGVDPAILDNVAKLR